MQINYHYIKDETYDKTMKLNEYSCLRYFSKKAFHKKYPRGGYLLVGGVGEGLRNKQGSISIGETNLEYYALYYSRYRYGIDGYISIGENKYIVIIGKRRLRNILVGLATICCIGLIIASVLWLFQDSGIDRNAKDYIPPENLNIETDPNHIAIPGYKEIVMHAETDTAYMALWNPPNNPCYFQFTIINKETKKELYRSKLIPPGKAVTEIKFKETIKEGIYPIQVKIDTYSLEDKEVPLNGGVSEASLVARAIKK